MQSIPLTFFLMQNAKSSSTCTVHILRYFLSCNLFSLMKQMNKKEKKENLLFLIFCPHFFYLDIKNMYLDNDNYICMYKICKYVLQPLFPQSRTLSITMYRNDTAHFSLLTVTAPKSFFHLSKYVKGITMKDNQINILKLCH